MHSKQQSRQMLHACGCDGTSVDALAAINNVSGIRLIHLSVLSCLTFVDADADLEGCLTRYSG
jgi:hypothetical protein